MTETVEPPLEGVRELLRRREASCASDGAVAARYPRWALCLRGGFNLLLHGFGSKRRTIAAFLRTAQLGDVHFHTLVANGFDQKVTADAILRSLASSLKIGLPAGLTDMDVAWKIRGAIEKQSAYKVLLVIHNIDGPSLRHAAAQETLSVLGGSSRVSVLASVDHINAQALWERGRLSRLQWVYESVNSYAPYAAELAAGESRVLGLSSGAALRKHSLASLDSVWASLTANAKKVLGLLVGEWLEARRQEGSAAAVKYSVLYRLCKREFCEKGLAHQMVEFQDHQIVGCRKGGDGSESYAIVVERRLLLQFLANHGHNFDGEDDHEE